MVIPDNLNHYTFLIPTVEVRIIISDLEFKFDIQKSEYYIGSWTLMQKNLASVFDPKYLIVPSL